MKDLITKKNEPIEGEYIAAGEYANDKEAYEDNVRKQFYKTYNCNGLHGQLSVLSCPVCAQKYANQLSGKGILGFNLY